MGSDECHAGGLPTIGNGHRVKARLVSETAHSAIDARESARPVVVVRPCLLNSSRSSNFDFREGATDVPNGD